MNIKSIVCQTCLSKERQLFSIRNLSYLSVSAELMHINVNSDGGVCWECRRMLVKFSTFREQVEFAQRLLIGDYQCQDLKCFSSLSFSTTNTYDNQTSDPLTSETLPLTLEPETAETKEIKEETEDLKLDFDYEEPVEFPSDVYVQENIVKKEVTIKKKFKKVKQKKKCEKNIDADASCDEVKRKFIEVEFTEEEMLKNREDKRNHPNFKKLPFNCNTCVLGFTRQETFDSHMDKKHKKSIGTHICPVCQVCFTSGSSLNKHVRKHYHCYRCKLCSYQTTELWSAVSHCRVKHSGDTEDCIHCQQCSYVAKTPEELAEHKKTHTLTCNECGEKFKGPNTLKSHLRRIHGTVREHKCPLCPRAFRSRGRLEAHATAHGAAAAARLAYCAACRVQYKNIYVYRNHLSTSARHSETRYHCEVCNKKFASKVYYKRHYTFYHQKSSPFKCEQCNRLFISDWRLRNHRQMQHGLPRSRDHACNECGKKFFTPATLRAHRLTHSSRRSFMCEACGDTFKQRPALYTHARLVHRAARPP